MPSEILTTDDLREFKIEFFAELKKILKEYHGQPPKNGSVQARYVNFWVFRPAPSKTCA